MRVVLDEQDLLPLIQNHLLSRYPEFNKARVQFVMKRKTWFSDKAVLTVECELIPYDIDQVK